MNMLMVNEHRFKEVAHNLERLLNSRHANPTQVTYENILSILIGGDLEDIERGAREIFNNVQDNHHSNYGHCRVLDLLSFSIAGQPFGKLKVASFDQFIDTRKFLKIPMPVGSDKKSEVYEKVEHPFPNEFKELKVLEPWQDTWERYNVSTKEIPFLTPPPPLTCFEGNKLRILTHHCWPDDRSHEFYKTYRRLNHAEAGAIVLNGKEVVGCMSWYWWGHREISGTDFSLSLIHKGKLIRISFDLRPYHANPTCGPNVSVEEYPTREARKKLASCVRSIRSKHRKVERQAEYEKMEYGDL